jgi:hypothetical protein
VKIDFQNVIIGFLTQAVTVDIVRMINAKAFQIVVHSATSGVHYPVTGDDYGALRRHKM